MTDIVDRLRTRNGGTVADEAADEIERLRDSVDRLLAHCPDVECSICAIAVCPHEDPFHFHHDGSPSCAAADEGQA